MSTTPDHLLICGLGSIGRRHLRHFRAAGVRRIDAFRTGRSTLADDGQPAPDRVFHMLPDALAERPSAVVVTNPTALHVPTALEAVRAGCDVLIEKPLSHELEGCDLLIAEAGRLDRVAAVANNLRFHPTLALMREWATGAGPFGAPVAARAHFGAYLPAWHPWEDYRTSYAARADLGGGAALTSIHETDYCTWLFGTVRRASGMRAVAHPLGTDVDEVCTILLSHDTGVLSTITLSLAQRPPSRTLEIVFERGRVECDLAAAAWRAWDHDGNASSGGAPAGFDIDQTYRLQAEAFLRAVRREAPVTVSLEEGRAAVRAALTIKETS